MQETILIQTDFRPESLQLVEAAIQNNPNGLLGIVLVHGVEMSESITELLFFSRHKMLQKLSNTAFDEGLNELRKNFADRINSLRIELFTGFNQAAFNNFIEAHNVTQIFVANDYHFQSSAGQSKDLSAFISKCVRKKITLSWSRHTGSFNQFALSQ